MNKSIRYKLLAYMTGSIVLFALLLFLANTFFAEKYYTQHKKELLIKSSKEIAQRIEGLETETDFQEEKLVFDLNKLEKSIGGAIVIGKMDGTQYYPVMRDLKGQIRKALGANPFYSFFGNGQGGNRGGRVPLSKIGEGRSYEPYEENSFFVINKDPSLSFETLRFQTQLENGIMILVWIPMTEISGAAAVSNNFTAMVAFITLLITVLWAFYISDRFTKPITEINNTAKRMAELDFSKSLNIEGEDEIAQLSRSINYLSHRLDEAIGELNRKNKKLESDIDKGKKVDAMRREFVSNVSHELKTPIFLIQGYAEGLRANVASDEEKRSFYCDVIMEEAEKMDIIVKDLLDLSQIEAGKIELNRCDFDIAQMVEDTLKKLQPLFAEKQIETAYETASEAWVSGDPLRIEQVLVNYLNNAINHTDSRKQIRITIQKEESKVRVSVFNAGQTIPEELLDRIWASFYKVDQARSRSCGGTGLGLAIVRAIQQAHGNGYGVRNLEQGVEFWFDIKKANFSI